MNLYESIPFWIVIILGVLHLPFAVSGLQKRAFYSLSTAFVFYLIAFALSVFTSTHINLSIPVLFLNLAFFSIFLALDSLILSQKSKELFALIFMTVCALLSVISIYYTIVRGYTNLTSEGLSFMWGYLGHNHLAVPLIVTIPLSIYFLKFSSRRMRVLYIFLLLFFLFSLLITFARGAILSLVIAFILALIVFLKQYRKIVNYKLYTVFGVTIFALIFSLLIVINNKSLRSVYIRSSHFQKGVAMFLEKPIFGYGPGTFVFTNVDDLASKRRAFYPHNLFIQASAEGGLVLLLATLSLFFLLTVSLARCIYMTPEIKDQYFRLSLWVGIVGILVNEMVDFDLQLPALGLLFWVMVGLVYKPGVSESDEKNLNER